MNRELKCEIMNNGKEGQGVTLERGEKSISVEQVNGFGKKPGLWVGNGNELVKVASFGSAEKAEMFCKHLREMLSGVLIAKAEKTN